MLFLAPLPLRTLLEMSGPALDVIAADAEADVYAFLHLVPLVVIHDLGDDRDLTCVNPRETRADPVLHRSEATTVSSLDTKGTRHRDCRRSSSKLHLLPGR